MSRDKTCEARGCGAYQSGIEGCHDEWFHREARIARLCMMFMQDGDGVRSVRKVASARYRLRAPTSEPALDLALPGTCTEAESYFILHVLRQGGGRGKTHNEAGTTGAGHRN